MHSCLRPELRAAQRVLRVIKRPYISSPRIVVRSFASFSRLREVATPGRGSLSTFQTNSSLFPNLVVSVAAEEEAHTERWRSFPPTVKQTLDNFYHSELREKIGDDEKWEYQSLSGVPVPVPEYGEGFEGLYNALKKFRAELDERDKLDHWSSRTIRRFQESRAIRRWLDTGEVPDEHRVLEKPEDVPYHLRDFVGKFEYSTQLPCLYSENPIWAAHWHPVGASLRRKPIKADEDKDEFVDHLNSQLRRDGQEKGFMDHFEAQSPEARSEIIERIKSALRGDTPTTEEDSSKSDEPEPTPNSKHYGSWQRRRKRQRENKIVQFSTPVPQWFLDCNVAYANPAQTQKTGVVSTPASAEPQVLPVAAADGAQVQVNPQEKVAEPQPEPLRTTYGKGRSGPSPEDDSDGASGPPKVPTSTVVNTKALGDGRYFVDEAQYEELFNTFKGRLQSPVTDSNSQNKVYDALNHLTILHGARDSEILLDTLVQDMCNAADVNRIHLDAQDITQFLAQAEKGRENISRVSRLSWKVYKQLYGADEYQETAYPRQEEEDNEEGEEEDENESTSIDIPIGSIFPNLGNLSNKLSESFRRMDGFGKDRRRGMIGMSPIAVMSPSFSSNNVLDTSLSYTPTVEAIFSSVLDAANTIPQSDSTALKDRGTTLSKPLVIHIENYKVLQLFPAAEAFLGTLISVADSRREAGQTVMVVGTDSLLDFSKSGDPRSILENQAEKSYGASTAVVLTPVFPNRDAELALVEDRKTRIRTVNARHLHQVLRSRGQLFHGLEDGFWRDDFKEAIGERDYDALSSQYWSFVQVQRIAAIMAGIQSEAPLEDACSIITASDESKVAWVQRNQPDIQKREKKEESRSDDRQLRSIRAKASRHEKKLLSGVVESSKIQTTFEDIHIPVETTDALKMLTTLSLQRPEAFRYGVLKSDRIPGLLLYGPPGTGKTLAAKAVAKESGATMLEVSAADLNDMYVGEGEKNVQALFSLAKKLSPCVVFLDEADAMFSARSTSRRASHRELLNQFLKEWDGMSNDSGSAFIMVATNRPMDLDDAVLRRLPRRILVDLPTEDDRLKILKIHLRNEDLDSSVNLADFAKRTPFYSGSDLKNVAVAAALNAVRDENDAAAKFRSENPDDKYDYPARRTLTQKHFEKALEEITASISQDMSSLREIKKFDEQYGDKKGRKRKSPKWGFKSAAEADKVLDTVKVRS